MATEGRVEHAQPPEGRGPGNAPVAVRSCSRLGLQANPPSPRLTLGRWRRAS